MARKLSDKMVEFAEERGGMAWCELIDYARKNDERWFKYLTGPNSVRVRFEIGVRGWDPSITPDDISEDVGDMVEGLWGPVSRNAAAKLQYEILTDERFEEWERRERSR